MSLTRALIGLAVVLVGINVASAVWDIHQARMATEARAARNFSNLTRLLTEQTAASMEAVDLVLRNAARSPGSAQVAGLLPRLQDDLMNIPHVAAFLVLDARGQVVARTGPTPAIGPDV